MTTEVVTADAGTTFHRLVDLLIENDVSGIPVVDADQHPIGIVTEADLVSKEAFGGRRRVLDVAAGHGARAENTWAAKARGLTAADLMSSPVRTVRPDDLVRLAAARMLSTGVKRLPVVDADQRLVGIVGRSDVLGIFHRDDDQIDVEVERILGDPLLVPEDHTVTARVHEGIVTLEGGVEAAGDVRLIETMVRDAPGVIDVVSRIAIRRPSAGAEADDQ
jgi:CBS domain-containing protein